MTLVALLGLSSVKACRDKVPQPLNIEQGVTRELYYQVFYEVNGNCIELDLKDFYITRGSRTPASSSFTSEMLEGQDAIRLFPNECLSEGSTYYVTAEFGTDEDCFGGVSKTVETALTFVNDKKYPCVDSTLTSYSFISGLDKEITYQLPFFS